LDAHGFELHKGVISPGILQTVVQMTNLYATSKHDDGSTRGSHKWYRLTISELLSFFGVMMLMALKKLPLVHLHWSRKYSDLFRIPVIRNAMSCNQFEDILKYIHLVDNKEVCADKFDPSYSKIAKTAWLVDDITNSVMNSGTLSRTCMWTK
jgi:hypothetical protein